ncbi:hypothetical protein EDE05_12847 [Neorhizobium sp. R1-B]|uniref:DUF1643 domain-containing protein n=1 Tax=Neorhizobium sp. R1-B TaxID=2485162 RepID=UPI0010653103|nr:DUF1643 domain-containing protein [Neorhizobium sp. R1-B]TDX72626.1 hypothetical protein EDE05_12847 [Neorhizobium sp. R1-B]
MTIFDLQGNAVQEPARIRRTALFSDNGLYRYRLTRQWDLTGVMLPVCMLNPSTADADKDDPTILTLMKFGKAWGYGGIVVINLFALRTSSPQDLKRNAWPHGLDNNLHLEQVLSAARHTSTPVLAAWGNDGAHWNRQDEEFCRRAKTAMVDLVCLGLTKDGFPKHPLARGKHRIPSDQKPLMWRRWMDQ